MSTNKSTIATEQRQEQLKDVHAGITGHVVTSQASHETAARLASGYGTNEQRSRDERVSARKNERDELAARFKRNPQLEGVLALRQSAPQDFAQMNVGAMRIQISGYERDRHAFHKTGEFSKEAIEALSEQISLEARIAELNGIAQGGAQ
jgi:hypothetical protein